MYFWGLKRRNALLGDQCPSHRMRYLRHNSPFLKASADLGDRGLDGSHFALPCFGEGFPHPNISSLGLYESA